MRIRKFGSRSTRGSLLSLAALAGAVCMGLGLLAGTLYVVSEVQVRRAFDVVELSTLPTLEGRAFARAFPSPSAHSDSAALNGFTLSREASEFAPAASPRVAMIGDSWISKSKFDAPMTQALADIGLDSAEVFGIGQGGAPSRGILRNLIANETSEFSGHPILADGGFRYCVVIAGVNDSAQHLGPDYYAHHMIQIVRVLRAHGITPILVEVPEYGIEAIRAKREGLNLAKDMLLSYLFDDGEIDVVEKYRSVLRETIEREGLAHAVERVDFEPIVADYHESIDLYKDPAHLNDEGREILAQHVAWTIQMRMAKDARAPGLPVQVASR